MLLPWAIAAVLSVGAAQAVSVAVLPNAPIIEVRDKTEILNFDLIVHNVGDVPLRLVSIREQVYDTAGGLELEREVNANGKPSALSGLGDLTLQPGAYRDVFQPFDRYDGAIDLARIRLTLIFLRVGRPIPPVALDGDVVAQVEVKPRASRPLAYCIPLKGRILVHDGHDLYSHHRRHDLAEIYAANPARAVNANLYAYDLVRIGRIGELFDGDRGRKEDWLTFGAMISAPTDGRVVEAVDGVPDNTFVAGEPVVSKASEALDPGGFGNHVAIAAADGRVSWLLHMEAGTVQVKRGQYVKAGVPLGRVGFSGDSLFPHLHYTVTTASAYPSQGTPSYFRDFRRLLGARTRAVRYGQIDTGDIVQAASGSGCAVQRSSGPRP